MCRVVLGRSWLGSAGLCASDWLRGSEVGSVNYPACIFTWGACNRGIPDSGENAGKLESRICGEWGGGRSKTGLRRCLGFILDALPQCKLIYVYIQLHAMHICTGTFVLAQMY